MVSSCTDLDALRFPPADTSQGDSLELGSLPAGSPGTGHAVSSGRSGEDSLGIREQIPHWIFQVSDLEVTLKSYSQFYSGRILQHPDERQTLFFDH